MRLVASVLFQFTGGVFRRRNDDNGQRIWHHLACTDNASCSALFLNFVVSYFTVTVTAFHSYSARPVANLDIGIAIALFTVSFSHLHYNVI